MDYACNHLLCVPPFSSLTIFVRRNTFAFGAFIVFIIAGFLGQLYPQVIQRWRVEPQKQGPRKMSLLITTSRATLHAYKLEDNVVTEEEYPLTEELYIQRHYQYRKRFCDK